MFCSKCGSKMDDGCVFCTECGARLATVAVPEVGDAGPTAAAAPAETAVVAPDETAVVAPAQTAVLGGSPAPADSGEFEPEPAAGETAFAAAVGAPEPDYDPMSGIDAPVGYGSDCGGDCASGFDNGYAPDSDAGFAPAYEAGYAAPFQAAGYQPTEAMPMISAAVRPPEKKRSGGVVAAIVAGILIVIALAVAGVGMATGWFGLGGQGSPQDGAVSAPADSGTVAISVDKVDASAYPQVTLAVSMKDAKGAPFAPEAGTVVVHEYDDPDELYRANDVSVAADGEPGMFRITYTTKLKDSPGESRNVRVSMSVDSGYAGKAETAYVPVPESKPSAPKPAPSDGKKPADGEGYILPESGIRYLSKSEIEKLSVEELFIARNEIFARHGRGFKNEMLRDHFEDQPWYAERYSPSEFDSMPSPLNDFERKNIDLIIEVETAKHSPYL